MSFRSTTPINRNVGLPRMLSSARASRFSIKLFPALAVLLVTAVTVSPSRRRWESGRLREPRHRKRWFGLRLEGVRVVDVEGDVTVVVVDVEVWRGEFMRGRLAPLSSSPVVVSVQPIGDRVRTRFE
jgi:hypothetical protein